ncbi:hypothetical protein ACEPAF_5061 [Sanghuangporus sanghuang]
MSNFASNLANLARSKLHDACSSGSRDNISLHRWVLLKNSITTQDVLPDQSSKPASDFAGVSESSRDSEPEFEDEEVDSVIDESMFAFLFPDPGNAVATPVEDECASEEQWLDSLLESLGDDEDDDDDIKMHLKPVDIDNANAEQLNTHSRAEAQSLCTSFSEDFATPPSPIKVPYPVPYPPLNRPFELDSHACCFASDSSPYSHFDHHDIEDSEGSVPDAIEDTSDDESESVSTPFCRSRTSLNFVDPASVPLPRDRYEPHIYRGSDDYYPYEADPLPYSDYNSESTPVYSPYHQGC